MRILLYFVFVWWWNIVAHMEQHCPIPWLHKWIFSVLYEVCPKGKEKQKGKQIRKRETVFDNLCSEKKNNQKENKNPWFPKFQKDTQKNNLNQTVPILNTIDILNGKCSILVMNQSTRLVSCRSTVCKKRKFWNKIKNKTTNSKSCLPLRERTCCSKYPLRFPWFVLSSLSNLNIKKKQKKEFYWRLVFSV